MTYDITSYCSIQQQRCYINGQLDWEITTPLSFADFAKQTYKHYQIKYGKFFKMDGLCKLAFLTAEKLLHNRALTSKYDPTKIGIILSNASASLDTDMAYQKSMAEIPSPALFVYTLPNIMLGELSIRHKLRGENACFISHVFDADWMENYVKLLLEFGAIDACITGWVNKIEEDYQSILFLVEPSNSDDEHTYLFNSHNLKHLYGSINR